MALSRDACQSRLVLADFKVVQPLVLELYRLRKTIFLLFVVVQQTLIGILFVFCNHFAKHLHIIAQTIKTLQNHPNSLFVNLDLVQVENVFGQNILGVIAMHLFLNLNIFVDYIPYFLAFSPYL